MTRIAIDLVVPRLDAASRADPFHPSSNKVEGAR